jgi:hypothetical protein
MVSDPVNSKSVVYAAIPPFPLTADSVSVLASGTDRQRAALYCIKRNNKKFSKTSLPTAIFGRLQHLRPFNLDVTHFCATSLRLRFLVQRFN